MDNFAYRSMIDYPMHIYSLTDLSQDQMLSMKDHIHRTNQSADGKKTNPRNIMKLWVGMKEFL